MAKQIIVLSGPIGAGKSTLAAGLAQHHRADHVSTRQLIQQAVSDVGDDRVALQRAGDRLDRKTGGRWLVDETSILTARLREDAILAIDSVRTADQIDMFRKTFGPRVTHVHLSADEATLAARYLDRGASIEEFSRARRNRTEVAVSKLAATADVVIDTKQSSASDVLIRVAARLGFYGRSYDQLVDVLVGGAYGSEGKGHVASYLAREYGYLVRVGGPNAGHQVYERPKPYVFHQLPSGTRNSEARLIIGPGAVLEVDGLRREINECAVSVDRLAIDPRAMVIDPRDAAFEARTLRRWIGSTAQGVGAATARRIMRGALGPGLVRSRQMTEVRLAGHVPDLKPFVKETASVLDEAYYRGERILVEGTQGTGLSLYHGDYPHVTSRDTTVAGCLSEAGIAPSRLRRVVMVCRSYPIRVQNPDDEGMHSGPMGHELTWEEVAQRSGQSAEELRARERTSTTNRQRRVAEFSWALLRRSAALNGPTDVALTFADYLSALNVGARRFEQLTSETIHFIEEVERVAAAPVSLISTRFHYRSIIDRRAW